MGTPATAAPSGALSGSNTMYQGIARDGIAMKMLGKMGWKEGSGLGVNEDGMSTHIHVRKRREGTGIGADVAENSKHNWTVNTDAFDKVLKGLSYIHASSQDNLANIVESSSEDEKLPVAADERKSKKRDKLKTTKKSKKISDTDGEQESTTKQVSSKGSSRGLPQGRFQKREANKNVKGYSDKDLSAILGMQFTPVVWEPEADELAPESPTKKGGDKKRKKNTCLIVIEAPEPAAVEMDAAARAREEAFFALDPNWWGKERFVSGGRLGKPERKEEDEVDDGGHQEGKRGFAEEDQERLYNSTQAGATSGKQGLGIADRPKKVAGARWKGTKSKFDTDDGEPDQQDTSLSDMRAPASTCTTPSSKSVKWKKLAETVLEEAKGKLRITKLVKRVLSKVVEKDGTLPDSKEALHAECVLKLRGSKKFTVGEEYVHLSDSTEDMGKLLKSTSRDSLSNKKRKAAK